MAQTRRRFLAAGGVGLLSFVVAGCERKLTPAAAREAGAALSVLSTAEAQTLAAFADALVPGSEAAGLAHYVDHQLGATPREQMLMIKSLGVEPPFGGFYRGGIAALDALASARSGKAFGELARPDAAALAGEVAGGRVEGWDGPPPGFFYFVVRSDACDVLYGTEAGFESLGVPYAAHIRPPTRWGA